MTLSERLEAEQHERLAAERIAEIVVDYWEAEGLTEKERNRRLAELDRLMPDPVN